MSTLAYYLDDFLSDLARRARPNTVRAYRSDLTQAATLLPGDLAALTLTAIEAFLVAGSAAPSTQNRRAARLARFFRWAQRQGYCATNPVALREVPRTAQRLPRPVRRESDLRALESAIAAAPDPYRLLFTLLRETGMRAGEVVGLCVGDVVLERGREGLHVREAKNHQERTVLLGADSTPKSLRLLRAWLRAHPDEPEHAPLFRSNRGTRLSYDALEYQWKKLCAKTGLVRDDGRPRYTLHQLRHTRGSELVQQGVGMEMVQRVLGHRDIRSTQGYADLEEVQLREVLERASRR